jgi:hypothetical protein
MPPCPSFLDLCHLRRGSWCDVNPCVHLAWLWGWRALDVESAPSCQYSILPILPFSRLFQHGTRVAWVESYIASFSILHTQNRKILPGWEPSQNLKPRQPTENVSETVDFGASETVAEFCRLGCTFGLAESHSFGYNISSQKVYLHFIPHGTVHIRSAPTARTPVLCRCNCTAVVKNESLVNFLWNNQLQLVHTRWVLGACSIPNTLV